MKRILFVTLLSAVPALLGPDLAADEYRALIAMLGHPDKQIREAALTQLTDPNNDTTSSLVNAVLDPAFDAKRSAAAAVVLRKRLQSLPGRENRVDRTKPYYHLQESDKQQLVPLVDYIRSAGDAASWRWYLAVSLLDVLDPPALVDAMPALEQALFSGDGMRQFAAVRAIYHLADTPQAKQTGPALLSLLYQCRRPFYGLFLREDRLLNENLLAYARDIRVYDDVATSDAYFRRETYYAHGDLLVSSTLIRLEAPHEDIRPRLVQLAMRDNSTTRLHACRQLVQLGASGQYAAARSLAEMIRARDPQLLRSLAEEYPYFVQSTRAFDPQKQLKTVQVLQNLGDAGRNIVAPLTHLLRDGDYRIRHVAAQLLGQLGERDRSAAVEGLQRALARESVAPLTGLQNSSEAQIADTAGLLLQEISQSGRIISAEKLKQVRDKLVFGEPPRPSQRACFNAMLAALLKLQNS